MGNIAEFKPRHEKEEAISYRDRVEAKLVELCGILDEARAAGFEVGFQIGDQHGKNVVMKLFAAKYY